MRAMSERNSVTRSRRRWGRRGAVRAKRGLLAVGVSTSLLATTPAAADEPLRLANDAAAQARAGASASVPNQYSSKSDLVAFERYQLANGLEVILHPDPSAPLVAVNVWYHVGSGDEEPGKSGFAHLFEHMMFQGAKHIGNDAHFAILREIGATGINGTTNSDRTNYFEIVPSSHLETALWLESDRMGYMLDLLDEKSLANQRSVVRQERRQRYDTVAYSKDRFAVAAALYPEGHPYRYLTIGRHEDIEGASLDDVRAFFVKWYVPSNATLVIAGDFEVEQAKALVDKWFGTFPKLPEPKPSEVTTPALTQPVVTEVQDEFARLVRLHWVWHSPKAYAKGDLELDVLADALGAEGRGRLSRRLVVEEKVAQRVSVYQSGANHTGTFHVVVDVSPGEGGGNEQAVKDIVAKVLAEATSSPLTDDEVKRAKLGIEAGLLFTLDDLMARAEILQTFNHYLGDPAGLSAFLTNVRALEAGAVLAQAKDTLSKPSALVITRPGGKQ